MADFWYDHVHIVGSDPQATAQWFVDKFRGELKSVWIAPNGVAHIIVVLNGANILVKGRSEEPTVQSHPPGSTYGLEHFALQTNDLDDAMAELQEKGVSVVQGITKIRSGARNAFIAGPDNTLIELIERSGVLQD